ncbi:YtpR family tRNA-binding protein [Exiguobacterium sp. NPDC077395]|uniref:YtpR family tRNA-binding protein n=1 Tax=Exiguobacterium sp. NPDC077395 TaxID=3390563 RepID=UPI003CFEAD58
MNVFYNREGIGDVLMVLLKEGERHHQSVERTGDVAIVKSEDGTVNGYNLFQASKHFDVTGWNGPVDLTTELVEQVQAVLKEHGIDEDFSWVDVTPKFVVGYVESAEKHPDADKLSVCQVQIDQGTVQIVCGAPNVATGQKVVVAKLGAVMPTGLIIRPSALRGESSHGMICSARELNLPNAPQEKGILVLDNEYEVGTAFEIGR